MGRSLILHIHKLLECGGGSTVPSCFQSLSLFNCSLSYVLPHQLLSSVVWTLRKCSYSILILSSAKFLSGIQCRNTSILPGFDNHKITTKRKRKKQHIKKATFPFFFFSQTGDTTQLLQRGSGHVSPPSRIQSAASGGL